MSAKKQTALITGCNGFVGKWLIEYLLSKQFEVYGIDLQEESLHHLTVYRRIDILEAKKITDFLAEFVPDMIFHLAGMAFPPDADRSPRRSIEINILGVTTLLEAIRTATPQSRLLLVGSAKEYGDSIPSDGITEETPLKPANFYGISKYMAELLGLQYCRQFGIDVRCTRSFNHTGPGQSPLFVCSDWARQVAAAALGLAEPVVTVGDLNATIDFCDVRDVVSAYHAVLDKGKAAEVYNVCSGTGVDLSWILDYLCNKYQGKISVRCASEKKRGGEYNVKMIGSHKKLTDQTGWAPRIPLSRTLDELYDWWIEKLRREA